MTAAVGSLATEEVVVGTAARAAVAGVALLAACTSCEAVIRWAEAAACASVAAASAREHTQQHDETCIDEAESEAAGEELNYTDTPH